MRKIMAIFLVLSIILVSVGCSKNDLQTFTEAVKKTEDIKKSQTINKVVIENEFNTEGLTQETIKALNYFNEIEAKLSITFDTTENKFVSRNYFNFGGMGFDSSVYGDGERIFMKMPVVGKYMVLEENTKEYTKEDMPDLNGMMKKANTKWIELLKKDNVFSGEHTILNTEDGDVKATHFSVNLTGEQVKELLNEYLDIIREEEILEKNFLQNRHIGIIGNGKGPVSVYATTNSDTSHGEDKTMDLMAILKEKLEKSDIGNFRYDAYIDIDGYIIQENIEVKVIYQDPQPGEVRSHHFSLETRNWSIEKEQAFDFPKLTKENTLKQDELNQGIPFIFEDVLSIEDKEGSE